MLTDRRFLKAVLVVLAGAVLPGCALPYLAQAASGQWRLMRSRQPIEQVLAREETSQRLRGSLLAAQRIRAFASTALALPDNAAYRSYVDLHRPYVVWNVVAAGALSVRPRQWCYPIAGCVSYRGYFSEQSARRYALRLSRRGEDVVVTGVTAYSTLGHFADPVLSSMTAYSELDLAALIIHELAHQVAYLPGDSAFNEAFAMTVEEEGVRRYAQAQGLSESFELWRSRRESAGKEVQLLLQAREELARLYAQQSGDAYKREQKARVLAATSAQILALETRTAVPLIYGSWAASGLNNAHLVSVATYEAQLPQFRQWLVDAHGDLPSFYAAVRNRIRERRHHRA